MESIHESAYQSVQLDVKVIFARTIRVDSVGSVQNEIPVATADIVSHRQRDLVQTSLASLTRGIDIAE